MNLTIFAKKRKAEDGREFYTYLTTLKKKDGTELKCQTKFRESCGNPKGGDCPMNIVVNKQAANLIPKEIIKDIEDEDSGEIMKVSKTVYTLWISEWKQGEKYVDHSLDDFE